MRSLNSSRWARRTRRRTLTNLPASIPEDCNRCATRIGFYAIDYIYFVSRKKEMSSSIPFPTVPSAGSSPAREERGPPTIQDVAREAKVSTATVSRALSAPDRVAEATRHAVMAAIERTGYRVNQTARNLRRQRTGAIVVLVPNIGNPFFSRVLAGIEADRLARRAQRVDCRQSTSAGARRPAARTICTTTGPTASSRSTARCRMASSPPPIAGGHPSSTPANGAPAPGCRRSASTMRAARRWPCAIWSSSGIAGIGHILGPADNVLTHARQAGVERALDACGLAVRRDWFFEGDFSLAAGARAAQAWLGMAERPSAVTASSDEMACGFMSELHRAGVGGAARRLGGRLRRHRHLGTLHPGLTTIRQPRQEIGGRAASVLIGLHRRRRPERRRRSRQRDAAGDAGGARQHAACRLDGIALAARPRGRGGRLRASMRSKPWAPKKSRCAWIRLEVPRACR